MDINNTINGLTGKITDELIQIRRTIHQNLELGFEEFETEKLVSGALDKMGALQRTGVGDTGVVGVIEGAPALAKPSPSAPTWTRFPLTNRAAFLSPPGCRARCRPAATALPPPSRWARRRC